MHRSTRRPARARRSLVIALVAAACTAGGASRVGELVGSLRVLGGRRTAPSADGRGPDG